MEHWRIANACMSTTAITTLAFSERQGMALETWAALSHQQACLITAPRHSSRKQVEMSYCKSLESIALVLFSEHLKVILVNLPLLLFSRRIPWIPFVCHIHCSHSTPCLLTAL